VIRSGSRFRALVVALAALALTAGAALAGHSALSMPTAAAGGLDRAADATGKIVPVAHPDSGAAATDEDADEDADDDADKVEPAEVEPAEEEPAEQPAGDTGTAAHPDNHGKIVSEAAKAPTPAGFDNHGQYVRTIASDNRGHADTAKTAKPKTKTTNAH
jgi:hypothetical protein